MKEAGMSVAMVATEEILVMRQHVAPMKTRFQAITACALLQEVKYRCKPQGILCFWLINRTAA